MSLPLAGMLEPEDFEPFSPPASSIDPCDYEPESPPQSRPGSPPPHMGYVDDVVWVEMRAQHLSSLPPPFYLLMRLLYPETPVVCALISFVMNTPA